MKVLELLLIAMCGFCLASSVSWDIVIYVGERYLADSQDSFFLDVNGTLNSMNGIILGHSFVQSEQRHIKVDQNFGEINSVRIYQYEEDGLFLQKIVMSDGNHQYTFTCNCWVQTDALSDTSQPSWTLTRRGYLWNIIIYVGGQLNAESNGAFYLDINGTNNDMNDIELGRNFTLNEQRHFEIDFDFGEINSVRIFQNRTDGLFLQKIVLSDGKRQYTFPCKCWVQTDTTTNNSQPSWILKEAVGQWNITIYVGGDVFANSVGTFFLDVDGTRNDQKGIILGDAFGRNEQRFIVIEWDFGEINSIRVYQHADDGLFLLMVVMSDGNRQYTFFCNCWIQTDDPSAVSQASWTLTTTDCYWNDSSPNCTDMTQMYCDDGECSTCKNHYRFDGTNCFHLLSNDDLQLNFFLETNGVASKHKTR